MWDFDKFQSYLTSQYSLSPDWVATTLTVSRSVCLLVHETSMPLLLHQKRMQAIMTLCFDSVRHKLTHRIGFFDLLGFDFMVDTDYNVSPPHYRADSTTSVVVSPTHPRCG